MSELRSLQGTPGQWPDNTVLAQTNCTLVTLDCLFGVSAEVAIGGDLPTCLKRIDVDLNSLHHVGITTLADRAVIGPRSGRYRIASAGIRSP